MTSFTNPLNNIKVASPCSSDWDGMLGTSRQRYCGECKLNVYNLSGMTRPEAENLLIRAEGSICVRYFRRSDGTVLTQDCPVGWQAVKKRMQSYWTAAFSLIFGIFTGLGINTLFNRADSIGYPVMGTIPAVSNNRPITPIETIPPQQRPIEIMGAIAIKPMKTQGEVSNFAEVRREVLKKHGR
jgi:hypothetical protein